MCPLSNLEESRTQTFRGDSQDLNIKLGSGGNSTGVNWTEKVGLAHFFYKKAIS